MPYSSNNGKAEIIEILKRAPKNAKVLDFGAGSGTYAKLLNDLGHTGEKTAVEIWEPYIEQFGLNALYDDILKLDAQTAAKIIEPNQFDLIFIGDMLEHLKRDEALKLIESARSLLTTEGLMIISVPIGEYPQDEYMGNPYEAHVDTWHVNDVMVDMNPNYFFQRGEIGVCIITGDSKPSYLAPKIGVYMICKNEAKFIRRCITSIAGEVPHQLVIVDTGSTDNTLELIAEEQRGAPYAPIEVHRACISPWRFDDARNFALSMMDSQLDLCISIDADEVFEPGFLNWIRTNWAEQLLAGNKITRYNHSFQTIWDWTAEGKNVTKHFHERVHARFGYRWVHPVHEKLISENENAGWCTAATMTQKPDHAKDRPYKGPLELAIQEDPTDWKLRSFLASEHIKDRDYQKAYDIYLDTLKLPGIDEAFIQLQLASMSEWLGKPDQAFSHYMGAVQANPLREVYMNVAWFQGRRGQKLLAKMYFELAKQVTSETHGYMRNENAWNGGLDAIIKEYENE